MGEKTGIILQRFYLHAKLIKDGSGMMNFVAVKSSFLALENNSSTIQ